jgi:hypothetical protein
MTMRNKACWLRFARSNVPTLKLSRFPAPYDKMALLQAQQTHTSPLSVPSHRAPSFETLIVCTHRHNESSFSFPCFLSRTLPRTSSSLYMHSRHLPRITPHPSR